MRSHHLLLAAVLVASLGAVCPAPHPPAPPPPSTYRLQVYVHDADDHLLPSARVYRDNVPSEDPDRGGTPVPVAPQDAGAAWTLPPSDFNVCALADQYLTACAPVPLHTDITSTVKLTKRPGPPPPPPLPPIPTRDQLIDAKSSFQGLTCHLPSFGDMPFTDGVWTSLQMTKADRDAAYACKQQAGDQIATYNVSWAYREPGVPFNLDGRDLTNDLPTFRQYIREGIEHAFLIEITLAGDGLSHDTTGRDAPLDYNGPWVVNDPVGDTYGWQWLMHHFQGIYDAMGPTSTDAADLRPYIRWRSGYDGMVAWQPWQLTDQWLVYARQVIHTGVLAIELPAGFWAWSGESDDYARGPGDAVDVVQYEFPVPMGMPPYPPSCGDQLPPREKYACAPWDPQYNQVLQIAKRMLGPVFRRPADLAPDYDPGRYNAGPLGALTSRGRRQVQAYEVSTYLWSRQRQTANEVCTQARYLKAMGWPVVSVPSSCF